MQGKNIENLIWKIEDKKEEGFPGMATRASVESLGSGGLRPRFQFSARALVMCPALDDPGSRSVAEMKCGMTH
jgi:hypothetical protein